MFSSSRDLRQDRRFEVSAGSAFGLEQVPCLPAAVMALSRLHPQKEDNQADERDSCQQSSSIERAIGGRVSVVLSAVG